MTLSSETVPFGFGREKKIVFPAISVEMLVVVISTIPLHGTREENVVEFKNRSEREKEK